MTDSQQDEELQQLVLHLTQFRDWFRQQDLLRLQAAVYTNQKTNSSASRRLSTPGRDFPVTLD